jgi:hypothetical protein
MITAGFGFEARRSIGGNALPEDAVGAAEIADAADLLRQFFIAPSAVDQNSHLASLFLDNFVSVDTLMSNRESVTRAVCK